MLGKFRFNPKWLTEEEYKNYGVRQLHVKGDFWKALCIVCNKTITITAMGEIALCKWHGKHQTSLRIDATANVQRYCKANTLRNLEKKMEENLLALKSC